MTTLLRYRRQKNISASKVAKELGLARSTISRYENEKQIPRLEIMLKIMTWSKNEVTPNDFILVKTKK